MEMKHDPMAAVPALEPRDGVGDRSTEGPAGPPALSIEEARAVLNRWAAAGFFRVKGLGDKAYLEDLVAHASYTLRLRSQFEDRTVAQVAQGYGGGPVDDRGHPPEPWEVPVRRPADFEDRTETLVVPHTERVQPCAPCKGDGRVTCLPCQGWGKTNCPRCHGTGIQSVTRPSVQPSGGFQTVQENCPACFAGKVNCPHCQGAGRVLCQRCGGQGRVKVFDQLTVHFRVAQGARILDETEVPDKLLGKVEGEPVVHERGPRIDRIATGVKRVDDWAGEIPRASHAVEEGKTRLLFQEVRVDRVIVQEIVYRLGDSPLKRFWVYGREQRVHAPAAPHSWARVLAVAGGALAVVVGIVLLIALLY